jgi:bacterioferritin (cytochrome b1)
MLVLREQVVNLLLKYHQRGRLNDLLSGASKRVLIIDGHPDPAPQRYVHALAAAYAKEAMSVGHDVRTVIVANLTFPALRTKSEYESIATCETVARRV